jgi:hypothetical protein
MVEAALDVITSCQVLGTLSKEAQADILSDKRLKLTRVLKRPVSKVRATEGPVLVTGLARGHAQSDMIECG